MGMVLNLTLKLPWVHENENSLEQKNVSVLFIVSWSRTKERPFEIIHMKSNDKGEETCEIWELGNVD